MATMYKVWVNTADVDWGSGLISGGSPSGQAKLLYTKRHKHPTSSPFRLHPESDLPDAM
jgi:hypothetical protein